MPIQPGWSSTNYPLSVDFGDNVVTGPLLMGRAAQLVVTENSSNWYTVRKTQIGSWYNNLKHLVRDCCYLPQKLLTALRELSEALGLDLAIITVRSH
jgi:hypothetical protein